MNLNQLAVFYAVAKERSFTRASKELFMTQPGVSKHVRALEEHFGTRLFDRLGKKVLLTQAGEVLFSATRDMFNLLDQAEVRINELQGLNSGKLLVGASVTIGIYIVPKMFKHFKDMHPGVEMALDISLSRQVVDKVLDNTVDLGLVGHKVDDDRLVAKPFMKDEFVVIVTLDHDWADRKSVLPEDLSGRPFLISRRGSGTKTVVEELLEMEGVTLENATEFGNTEAVKKGVLAGLGAAILSKYTVVMELEAGLLKTIPIEGVKLDRTLYSIYRKDKYLTNLVKAFLSNLSACQ